MRELIAALKKKDMNERLVAIDIGTSSIKIMELEVGSGRPKLVSAGMLPTPAGAINNNAVVKVDLISQTIRTLLDSYDVKAKKAVLAIPGPSVFTKKIQLGVTALKDLRENILFEASNYIPHKIEAVHFDFQVLRTNGKSTMDVLLVAAKNEVVISYLNAIEQAGLEPGIADVDYFALENMFELNYPEEKAKTVALINIGARYSSINIIQDGESLFTGDVGVGGRLYTDALCQALSIEAADAENAKMGNIKPGLDADLANESIERTTEFISAELHRQLGFFWNAAATDKSIEAIFVCGGSSQLPGLIEELSAKTGLNCTLIETLRGVDCSGGFDADYLQEIAPAMAVSVGLAARRLSDKKHAIS